MQRLKITPFMTVVTLMHKKLILNRQKLAESKNKIKLTFLLLYKLLLKLRNRRSTKVNLEHPVIQKMMGNMKDKRKMESDMEMVK